MISSAGRRVSLLRSFRSAIAETGLPGRVIACDMSRLAPAMHVADDGFVVPRCTDPGFLPTVVELCARQRVDLVVPTFDTELPVWARARAALASAGTVVAVSAPETVAIAGDKRRTHEHCRRVGIPVPRQATPAEVLARPADWPLPLIAKPATGFAGQGLRRVETWSALESLASTPDLVVEEVAAGLEHTVDVYVDRAGQVHAPVARRRLEIRAGEVSKSLVVRDGHLESLAVKTVETLPGAYGPLNVQMFSDGRTATVIEINARFGGGYPLTRRAGGRYSEWLVRETAFGAAPPARPRIEHGLMMLRWDEEVFVEDARP